MVNGELKALKAPHEKRATPTKANKKGRPEGRPNDLSNHSREAGRNP
jgi:hypothetical protein